MNLSWGQLRRLIGIFVLAVVGLAGATTLGGSVAAHHPVLESQTNRPCGDDAAWTTTVTSRSDKDWNKDWRNRFQIDGGAPSTWSQLTDDQVPYVFEIGPFDASVTSTTGARRVTVVSQTRRQSVGHGRPQYHDRATRVVELR